MASAEDKDQLAALLRAAHREALDALDGVDHSCVVYEDGGWTVRDVLGNLVAWEAQGLAALQAHSTGGEYHPDDATQTHSETKDLAAAQLYAEWEAVRELLRAAIIDMPADRLLTMVHSPWGEYAAVDKMISDLIAYQQEHLNAILRSKDKRAS